MGMPRYSRKTALLNSPNIVLVDDNPCDVLLLRSALTDVGSLANIHAFTNAGSALAYMREHPVPDLIILDLRLPEETGLEIAAKLQSDSRLETVRTILLSGLFSPSDLAAAAQRGLTCLQKGFCLEGWTELANHIDRCVTSEPPEALLPAA